MIVLFLLFPKTVLGISNDYKDEVYNITNCRVDNGKINIYLFYGEGCVYCAKENEFLTSLEDKYREYINVYRFETWYNSNNEKMMNEVKEKLNVSSNGVPFTIIGLKTYTGYNEYTKEKIIENINKYLQKELIENTSNVEENYEIENNILNKEKTSNKASQFINKSILVLVTTLIIIGLISIVIWITLKHRNKF